ncbi:MAG: hypothetical protein J2P17_28370 [Mycobacterium sp.]|nr:hypothetical protein [Mycobacterium sp.]
MSETRHGYHDGERVRDRRHGTRGRVRFLELTDEERASGDVVDAEIVWDGSCVADELELALPHLERIAANN